MRHTALRLLAASSLLLVGLASAATRPHYGGNVRVTLQDAPASLDPAGLATSEDTADSQVSRLIFDTLVTLDWRARVQPALATAWQADPGTQRWQLSLRPGVQFSDGTPLTSDAVAASLRLSNPTWKAMPLGNAVTIECAAPCPGLPAELALAKNAIVKRDGKPLGTGPFAVADSQAGKKTTLAARDEYWGGRPFADSIEFEMSKNPRERMMALDLGRADIIEIPADQAHRAVADGRRTARWAPVELIALVFARDRQNADDGRLREALALSIDRPSIRNVLLQGEGVAAGGILPNWLSGYAFLFPVDADLQRARQIRNELRQAPAWTLSYDANDPLARLIAERVALNARDAGITLQVSSGSTTDLRIQRVRMASSDAHVTLAGAARSLGLSPAKQDENSAEDLYAAENALLQSQRVIPLLHLPVTYGLSGSVRNWNQDNTGAWHLEDVWLDADKP